MKKQLIGLLSLLLISSQGLYGSAPAPAALTDAQLLDLILEDDAQAMASYLNKHPEIKDKKVINGIPLLHHAAQAGAYEIVSLLLLNGWNYHITQNDGSTLWHDIVWFPFDQEPGLLAIAQLLANHRDLDINAKTSVAEQPPLMVAAISGNASTVKFLLEHGADATLQDSNGATAFLYARNDEIRELLEKAAKGK